VWTYIVRRLLLMIPMLFGISIVNFAILNLAPAPRSSNVTNTGDLDLASSMEANEGEHIFRRTFNLDKPAFLNTRYGLRNEEILWRLTSPQRSYELPKDRTEAKDTLDDYGRTIVPHALRIAELAHEGREELRTGPLRADYERRWREARSEWLAGDRPTGDLAWPPPEEAPPFDDAFCDRLRTLALARLANNAPRRPILVYSEEATEELLAYNREVREEQIRLRRIFRDTRTTDAEKLALWRRWYEERAGEWDYTAGETARMLFLETRFAKFWGNLLTLDLGTSYIHRQKVWKLITDRIAVSLTLSLGSLVLAYLISLPFGILSAVKHRSRGDAAVTVVLFGLYSMPTMFLGTILLQYLAINAKIFPVQAFHSPGFADLTAVSKIGDVAWHLVLPLATLTVGAVAYYSRYMKAGLIETIREDYVRTARAKGLSEFVVVLKHAVRNGLIPIITLLGASLPVILGGSIVVEFIFEIEGMGKLAYESVLKQDYAVIMGLNILTAVLTMVGIFLADLAYAVVDPRIRYK
jgi:peptide/nickel transport system permease protein